jgi:hypothetical protein
MARGLRLAYPARELHARRYLPFPRTVNVNTWQLSQVLPIEREQIKGEVWYQFHRCLRSANIVRPGIDDRQGAKAIVLDFIDPVLVIEGLGLLNQGHGLWNKHDIVTTT